MARFLVHWIVVMVALAITARLLPGLSVRSIEALVLGGLVLGFANALAGPLLQRIDLPITVTTFGLFLLALNMVAFGVGAWLAPRFTVGAMWQLAVGAVVVTIVSWLVGASRLEPVDAA